MSLGGALAAPSTAYHLRLEHAADRPAAVAEKELMSYKTFPPLQAPETYNLSGILEQVKKANASHASD